MLLVCAPHRTVESWKPSDMQYHRYVYLYAPKSVTSQSLPVLCCNIQPLGAIQGSSLPSLADECIPFNGPHWLNYTRLQCPGSIISLLQLSADVRIV